MIVFVLNAQHNDHRLVEKQTAIFRRHVPFSLPLKRQRLHRSLFWSQLCAHESSRRILTSVAWLVLWKAQVYETEAFFVMMCV